MAALVERARSGDVDAWEAVYRQLYPQLHAFARRRLPADHLADDAVSEAMTRALTKLAGFAPHAGGFEGWLFGILRNVVRENIRSFARGTPMPAEIESSAANPLLRIVDAEKSHDLRLAFAKLNDDEREMLELRTVAKLSAESVGEVLMMSSGAVRTAQSRALGRLRTFFEEVNGER